MFIKVKSYSYINIITYLYKLVNKLSQKQADPTMFIFHRVCLAKIISLCKYIHIFSASLSCI